MSRSDADPARLAEREALAAALDERRRVVDAALDAALPRPGAWPAVIHEAMRYSVFAGGKRLRPVLVLAAGEAVGGGREPLLPFACAVEMIHTYSLIHDDLPAMDDDDLRRGKPTCHKAFGEANAILAGDALLTLAFRHLAADPPGDEAGAARRLAAIGLLAEACGTAGLVGGQVMDLAAEGGGADASTVEQIHRAKTGALLTACVEGAAILAGAPTAERDALARYGRAVGLAFQVVDDLLDVTGDTSTLGKTAGKDASEHKATYVGVHGVDGARRIAGELLEEAFASLVPLGDRARLLSGIARRIVERRA